jgi:pimeloyl-ACP methyl ester carboxylesterase
MAVVLLALVAAPAGAAPSHHEPVDDVELTAPELDWADCGDGLECTTMTVPLDYADPDSDTIDLSLIRRPAADQEARIGSLLTNPGGPGESGVDLVRWAFAPGSAMASLNTRFDIVSWDPRGTEGSAPIDCVPPEEYSDPGVEWEAFPDLGDRRELVAAARGYNQACIENVGTDLLSAVSTLNTVRDMEMIRLGLGEDQISYLGFSYGTYLGATYASVYPDGIRAFVLDSAVDPRQYAWEPERMWIYQAGGFERSLRRFFDHCEQEECQFSGGHDGWRDLVDAMEENPIETEIDPARPVDGATVVHFTLLTLYSRRAWAFLDQGLHEAANGDASLIRQVMDAARGRQEDGSYAPGVGGQMAIMAVDQDFPDSMRGYNRLYPILRWISPSFGPLTWAYSSSSHSVYEWPVEANAVYRGPFRYRRSDTPILVVGVTNDPAAPYPGAVAMTEQLGNARLLTMDGDGHGATGGNSECIDSAVGAFLEDLVVPAQGTVCQQDVVPPASTASDSADSPDSTGTAAGSTGISSYLGELEEPGTATTISELLIQLDHPTISLSW